jgi:large repetitive protein
VGGGIATITAAADGWTGAAYITVPEGAVVGADVGDYNLSYGHGVAAQVAPIEAAGGTPVQLSDLTPTDLAQVGVLFVENPDNNGYAGGYTARLASIQAWVAAGGVLIFHDRHVAGAAGILPGGAGFSMVREPDSNIDVGVASTLVTDGPGGVVTDSNLDGGSYSHHGWITAASLPGSAVKILNAGAPGNIVTVSYRHGDGFVIYSTIPLDYYLTGNHPAAFRLVYAPNVVAYDVRVRPRAPGKGMNSAINDR